MTFTRSQAEKSPHDWILSILDIPEMLRDKEAVATKREGGIQKFHVPETRVLPHILSTHLFLLVFCFFIVDTITDVPHSPPLPISTKQLLRQLVLHRW